jgi:hypothetical protein
MLSRFTERSYKALILLAQTEAQAKGSLWVDTEHLLLGLLLEQGCEHIHTSRPLQKT